MSVYKLSASGGLTTGRTMYTSMLAGNPVFIDSATQLISSTILSSNQASVSFNVSQLDSSYKHLQIRMTTRDTATIGGTAGVWFWANSDTGSNYSWHRLKGGNNGFVSEYSISNTRILAGIGARNGDTSGIFGVTVCDILDFGSTTKNKTLRSLSGNLSSAGSSGSEIELISGAWYSTAAITTVNISADNLFTAGSRFSLYGIKG